MSRLLTPVLFQLRRFQDSRSERQLSSARLLRGFQPLPVAGWSITGVSRDSTGAPLAACICTLFTVNSTGPTRSFTQIAVTTSDGGGNFSFIVGSDGPYRVTFDLDGAPVRAGITLASLSGS